MTKAELATLLTLEPPAIDSITLEPPAAKSITPELPATGSMTTLSRIVNLEPSVTLVAPAIESPLLLFMLAEPDPVPVVLVLNSAYLALVFQAISALASFAFSIRTAYNTACITTTPFKYTTIS